MADEQNTDDLRKASPNVVWYAVGLFMIVGGAGAFAWSLNREATRIAGVVEAMPRVTLPAGGEITIETPGPVQVFYEGAVDGAVGRLAYDKIEPALVVQPVADADAPPLEVRRPAVVNAYYTEREGVNTYAVAQFDVPEAGTYRITGTLAPGDETPSRIAIGRLDIRGAMSNWAGVFGGAVFATLGFVVGSLIFVVTFLLRRRHYTTRQDPET